MKALILGILFLFAAELIAQPGSLDPSFGINGRVLTPFNITSRVGALSSNGEIIVGGYIMDSTEHSMITKVLSNGSIDSSFGTNGIVKFNFWSYSSTINAIAIQADGKIVTGGFADTGAGPTAVFTLARFNSNGTFDNSFGQNGMVITYANYNQVACLLVQSDGKIVLSGGNVMVRYNSNGSLDGSFTGNGIDTILGQLYYRRGIAQQIDSKILVVGSIYIALPSHQYYPAIARYNTDGTIDNTFGLNGSVIIQNPYLNGATDYGQSMALQDDGKILISDSRGVILVRLNPDGTYDSTFGTNGAVLDSSSYASLAGNTHIQIQNSGKILKAGTNTNYYYYPIVTRYNSDGSVDRTFANNGRFYPPLAYYWDLADFLLIQSDDKIVFGGEKYGGSGGTFADLRRLLSDSIINAQPNILLSQGSLSIGHPITIFGRNFTAVSSANIIVNGPNSYQKTWSVSTSNFGKFTSVFLTDSTMPIGHYTVNGVDSTTGIYAPVKSFILNSSQTSNGSLKVVAPFAGDTLSINDTCQITWHDKMVLGSQYPVSGAHRSYYYDVDYSNDNGNTWHIYTSLQGSAYVNSVKTFHVPIAFSTVGNRYYVRVVDHYNTANRDSSGAIIVVSHFGSGNIKAQLYWDFSYSNQNNALYGVAADGAARLYAVVSKIDTSIGGNISNVSVHITDDWNNNTATLGKVMAATQVSTYSNEANTANSLSATQNTETFSRFWFWYVAPNDFVGNNPTDSLAAYRYVTAHFFVHYSGGNTDTISKKIKIVRPPLCFVHGLASDPNTWFTFSSNGSGYQIDFLNDSRFYTNTAIQIDPTQSFDVNAQFLVIGFSNTNSLIFQNSLQGVIKNLRNQGYATNRCDYIGHSMGGSILRYALDNYSNYFYRSGNAANRDYKNYGQGYVNKVITLCTPHNGSPWADILNRYVGQLSYVQRAAIQTDYNYFPNSLPFSFITQDQSGFLMVPTFRVVDAVRDLQIDSTQGGVKFLAQNVNMHLISAGIYPGANYNSSNYMIPQQVINTVDLAAQDVDFLNDFADATIANEHDQQVVSDLIQIGNTSSNPVQTALQYLERMADFYNIATFIPSSDLVVSKSSALENNPVTAPNVSVFDNYIGHAFINPILNDLDAGNKVNYLFNAPIGSSNFAPVAASSYFLPNFPAGNQRSTNSVSSIFNPTVLKIVNPANVANLTTDSIIDIQINLPDTTNLISLKVRFQNKTYKVLPSSGIIHLNTQVNSNILDSSFIYAQAFYKFADSSIFYYDSVLVNVTTTSNLISFAAQQQIIYLNINQEKFPDYVSGYQGFATSVGNFSKFITATVNNSSIAIFDPVHKGFKGVSTGETYALVSYKGLTDTIYLVVGENPLDSVSTGIKPISNATINTMEPRLICYPNPFDHLLNISFDVSVTDNTTLKIYDLMGREVASLIDGKREQGQYQLSFDGSKLTDGMYLCELRNGNKIVVKKIVSSRQ